MIREIKKKILGEVLTSDHSFFSLLFYYLKKNSLVPLLHPDCAACSFLSLSSQGDLAVAGDGDAPTLGTLVLCI